VTAAGAALRLRVFEHDVVDSTSERAFEELAAGRARHGDVHIAREQTAGRGRRGASWASARDLGSTRAWCCAPRGPCIRRR
jgi:biotin-(acetyl-CoA carboxylase) ligase